MAKNKATAGKAVTVMGKVYDLDELESARELYALVLPDNWPSAKGDGVRVFLALLGMISGECQRHFAHNFKLLAKTAMDQQVDGEAPKVAVNFAFEVDLTASTVAALGKTKMSFSRKYSTEGKAKAHDVNQGEFLAPDLSVVLDTKSLDAEMAPEPEPPEASGEGEGEASGGKKKKGKRGKNAAANDTED